ncbi:MAG: AAA family ATPase [Candidatus Saccharimonadales bacterium]
MELLRHPVLILIRGLPGSGKSYLAKSLQKAFPRDGVVMLDPDATDYQSKEYLEHVKALTTEGVDASLHAYRFLRAKAYAGISDHKIIIWNQPFTNLEIFNKMVGRLLTHVSENGSDLPILVVEVEIDPAAAKQRIAQRKNAGGHGPSDHTLAQRINDYKSFAEHGYNTVAVDGEKDVSDSVASVLKALAELLQKS